MRDECGGLEEMTASSGLSRSQMMSQEKRSKPHCRLAGAESLSPKSHGDGQPQERALPGLRPRRRAHGVPQGALLQRHGVATYKKHQALHVMRCDAQRVLDLSAGLLESRI